MFRYRLRTLLLLTILGPPVLAGVSGGISTLTSSSPKDGWSRCTDFEFDIDYPTSKRTLGG
jgi:hypothetical protein